ncbi:chorismate dehydratase [Fibrobacterales bacterium]|nr:chorismate dehydratase [Fibrobacterales bacterium]
MNRFLNNILPVGRIPFLVCAPFFSRFFEKPIENVIFLDGVPRVQNRRLREKEIMLAPSSSIEYAKNSEDYFLCKRFCTASTLEIRSVKLFSKYKWEELDKKNIQLTAESDTSAALVKLLSSKRYMVKPQYSTESTADTEQDAKLLIGDSALLENISGAWEYSYDLASVWQEWQGLPFVFGAWIIRKEAATGGLQPILENYLNETERGIIAFKDDRQKYLQLWNSHFSNGVPQNIALDYYNAVDYSFTSSHEKSLKKFYELCGMNVELAFI